MPDFTQNYNRFAYCLNNPLIYIDPTGQKSWLGKFTSWVGDGWDAMWEAGDQFAYWAAQNNISGNFGVTYNGAGNIGAIGSLNGQPLDLNGEAASIDRGVANAGISLFNQFAQMSGGSTGYRPLDRGLIPFVNAEPLIFNGAWYYDPSNPIFNYSLEQAQFNAWCQRASGRVELTDSPIDFLLGAGIGKAVFKGSSRLVGRVAAKTGMQTLTKAEMAAIKGAGTSKNLYFKTSRQALRQAKRDLGIPTSQSHITHIKNVRTDRLGGVGSDLIFDGGKTIQWHKTGHLFPSNPIPPHFNIHPVSKFHYIYGF